MNRLSILYDRAILESKPYRIQKIREQFNSLKARVVVQKLTVENYRKLFGRNSPIERAHKNKIEALVNCNFEEAAHYRDIEKQALRRLLNQHQIATTDRFFVWQGNVFEIG